MKKQSVAHKFISSLRQPMINSTNASQTSSFSLNLSHNLVSEANPTTSGQLFGNQSGQTSNSIFGMKAQGQSSPFGAISGNGGSLGSKGNIFNNNSNQASSTTNNNQTPNNFLNNSSSNNTSQQVGSNNNLQTIFGSKNETPSFSGTNTPIFGGGAKTSNPLAETSKKNSQSPDTNLFNGQKQSAKGLVNEIAQNRQGTQVAQGVSSPPSFDESNKQPFAFGAKSGEQNLQQKQKVETNQPAFGTNHTTNLFQASKNMFNNNQNGIGQTNSTGNSPLQGTNNIKAPNAANYHTPSFGGLNNTENKNNAVHQTKTTVPTFGILKKAENNHSTDQGLKVNKGIQEAKIEATQQGTGPSNQQNQSQPQLQLNQQRLVNQYEKSNKTAGEYVQEWKKILIQSYKSLSNQCQIAKSFDTDRKQNYKIINSFKQLEPVINQNKENTERMLSNIEKRQNEMMNILTQIKEDLGADVSPRYPRQHPVAAQMKCCISIRKEVNAEDEKYSGGQDEEPSNLQLKNIFCNLDSVQNEIRRLHYVLDHFFRKVLI